MTYNVHLGEQSIYQQITNLFKINLIVNIIFYPLSGHIECNVHASQF